MYLFIYLGIYLSINSFVLFIFFDYDIQLLENIYLRHIGTLYSMFNLATQTASRRNILMSAKERKKRTATRVGRAVAGYFPGILG